MANIELVIKISENIYERCRKYELRCGEAEVLEGSVANGISRRWIPVSEKLPPDDEDVLVQYEQGGMEVVYYHIDDTFYPTEYKDLNETGWFNENGDALYFEPIAWMPLPEPYKEVEK